MSNEEKPMSQQQQAINDYLQALLHDVDDTEVVEEVSLAEPEPEPQVKTLGLEQLVAEVPQIVEAKPATDVVAEVALKQEVKTEVVVETTTEVVTEAKPEVAVVVDEMPDWAEQSFQCLLFKVSGLTLAVPLVKLNSVIPWTDKIVETPNKTDWYLGLVNNHGKNVKVIDTALMVLPENRRASIATDAEDRFSHILLVNDSNWGLACDEIGDVIWLNNNQVKWRKNKVQRPWLAGTAIEQMCALMDTEVFADMLNQKISV